MKHRNLRVSEIDTCHLSETLGAGWFAGIVCLATLVVATFGGLMK